MDNCRGRCRRLPCHEQSEGKNDALTMLRFLLKSVCRLYTLAFVMSSQVLLDSSSNAGPMTNRVRPQSTASILAERLRENIRQGVYGPGDFLPQEEIAARYGVSRSPLREALRQLEAENWIVYHPNRGAFVAAISAKDIHDLYQVRRILEAGAIRLAAEIIDDGQLLALRKLDASIRRAADYREAVKLHRTFHRDLYAVAGNPKLDEAIARHHVRVQRLPRASTRVDAAIKRTLRDHREILDACRRHDPRAAECAVLEELDQLESIMTAGLE